MIKLTTPETDAFDCELNNPRVLQDRYSEMLEHARKLERERDEARKALMEIEDRCVDCDDACDDIQKIREIAVKALEGAK